MYLAKVKDAVAGEILIESSLIEAISPPRRSVVRASNVEVFPASWSKLGGSRTDLKNLRTNSGSHVVEYRRVGGREL